MTAGREVERRADGADGKHQLSGGIFQLAGPAHEGIAAQRNAYSEDWASVLLFKTAQDPADLSKIA